MLHRKLTPHDSVFVSFQSTFISQSFCVRLKGKHCACVPVLCFLLRVSCFALSKDTGRMYRAHDLAQAPINSAQCRCIQVPFGALYGRGNVHGFVCFVCVLFVCFLLYLRCQVLS